MTVQMSEYPKADESVKHVVAYDDETVTYACGEDTVTLIVGESERPGQRYDLARICSVCGALDVASSDVDLDPAFDPSEHIFGVAFEGHATA